MFPTFAVLLATSHLMIAAHPAAGAAAAMPQFDITANCRAEISTISGVSESLQQCVSDEQTARDALQPEWSGFIAHDQRECLQETGMDGTPSYVELKICLEMARDARRMRKNNT